MQNLSERTYYDLPNASINFGSPGDLISENIRKRIFLGNKVIRTSHKDIASKNMLKHGTYVNVAIFFFVFFFYQICD